MRICMVAYTNYEYDNRVMRYAESLVQRGDEVDVFAVCRKHQQKREVIRNVQVYRIQRRTPHEHLALSLLFKMVTFLFNSMFHVTLHHLRRRYDVIHVHSMPDFEIFCVLFAKLLGARCILDIHDLVPELYVSRFKIGKESWIYKSLLWMERRSARYANHVIAANHIWHERLIGRSVPRERCTVFLNYPDETIFKRAQKAKAHDDAFVMMYPGTLSIHQGLDLAIRALARIHERAPKARLEIYGDGSEREKLVALANELQIADRVGFHDFVPIDRIAGIMCSADLGVVPKRADGFGNEAFSTKILEFMTLGVPVLAADTRVDQYYFNDESIRFFRSGDVEDLAKCMLEMIENPATRERIAQQGAELARSLTWTEHRQRYYDLVDRLGRKRISEASLRSRIISSWTPSKR
ncbi:MAG: glycosyltransferase family 4 protein [Candidatus Hydrogenedentes bacterium]|nr:glycosyltransferase family 4 protein [Candidatus Hydrogenedentota bacterium]